MALQLIDLGEIDNPLTGDTLHDGGTKINSMMTELYGRDYTAHPPDDGNGYVLKDGVWVQETPFPEAPTDSKQYARQDAAWAEVNGFPEAPIDGTQYARQDGAWSAVDAGGGGIERFYGESLAVNAPQTSRWNAKDSNLQTWSRPVNTEPLNSTFLSWVTLRECSGYNISGNQTIKGLRYGSFYPGDSSLLTGISLLKVSWSTPNIINYQVEMVHQWSATWQGNIHGVYEMPMESFSDTSLSDGDILYVFFYINSASANGTHFLEINTILD